VICADPCKLLSVNMATPDHRLSAPDPIPCSLLLPSVYT
jgi:hypothetical protein